MSPSANNPGPRIFAIVPVKNEAHRYLEACLTHLAVNLGLSAMQIIDDGSDDGSFDLACQTMLPLRGIRWRAIHRPQWVTPFEKNEAAFRSYLLESANMWFHPRPNIDWILVNDADEFLATALDGTAKHWLHWLVNDARYAGVSAYAFGLDELWQLGDEPKRRIDKAWGNQKVVRLYRYQERPADLVGELASGSVPTYARLSAVDAEHVLRVVHAGYADPRDRMPKFERYNSRPGHSQQHVASIMDTTPTLDDVPWCPLIWRGSQCL